MHYCVMLISKSIPSNEYIKNVMSKYTWKNIKKDEDGNIIGERPIFTYDYYTIGGRYAGGIKLKVDESDKEYEWMYYAKEDRNNRLFISSILNDLKENIQPGWKYSEDKYLPYMGYDDGVLYVDGARAKDIVNINELKSYICIIPDGEAIARSSWNGTSWVDDEKYDEKFEQIIKDNMDGFITILDIHD